MVVLLKKLCSPNAELRLITREYKYIKTKICGGNNGGCTDDGSGEVDGGMMVVMMVVMINL